MLIAILKIYSWWFDATFIFLKYFFIAGTAYFIFYSWKKNFFARIKIQEKQPGRSAVQKEIYYSTTTLIIYCVTSWLIFYWKRSGGTKIYVDFHEYGFLYFLFSIFLMILMHDAYFYWTHRFMHHRRVFKWVHRIHHHSDNPTPWAAFSFHPFEAIISIGIIPIIVLLVPVHPFALFTFLTYMTLISVLGHLGYETFPLGFRNGKIGKWQNTSTNHNLHHQQSRCNYGLYFTFWDKLMNTYQDEIHQPHS